MTRCFQKILPARARQRLADKNHICRWVKIPQLSRCIDQDNFRIAPAFTN
jgi:hypothetical protein